MERTFVMLKPDAMQRGLAGELITRFERKGLVLVAAKMVQADDKLLAKHYAEHIGKPFYKGLCDFVKQAPVLATIWEGVEAVKTVRDLLGATNGRKAAPGTIRGDYSTSQQCNLVHASDSVESANREIANFFQPNEIVKAKIASVDYVYSPEEQQGKN